ncbi:MAG: tRNA (N(6)-L-threonylcarbamoyladenosine(37)-C(2))-methylthiotransferase MtaB [Oscillospiraceae bacterium]|jgi:threonylcarbamoyladenosine tRNA methylthiotransferase MtaB|nr:tRNA (N(6)-L-threonylcarbamoyladenosine(37)-C(2))-methylthiotransferase MtaB [Oscillospiraceae bacterium]
MRYNIETLGCKVNQYESAALAALLAERGHTPLIPEASGDFTDCIIILNTCAVTGEASRKSRQAARRLLREFPGAKLAVCGCASQLDADWARGLGASLVGGSGDRRAFVSALERLFHADAEVSQAPDDPRARREFEPLPSGGVPGRTRAMLKIQDGCDNFCAYCVIPYARGRARSLPLAAAEAEARGLAARGYREIVVTGIEISSYGKDLPSPVPLTTLLRAVANAANEGAADSRKMRIRLGSLEPSSVTPEFCGALAELPGLCGHFHLSLQSGCDATLRRMRRRYDTAAFRAALLTLRDAFPNLGASADLIVGFPGETDGEFAQTLAFLEECALSALHVFPYSKRPGTPAAAMDHQIPNAVKRERVKAAREVGARTRAAYLNAQVGRTLSVLFEREADGFSLGHAENYPEVAVPEPNLRGKVLPVYAERAENDIIYGKLAL